VSDDTGALAARGVVYLDHNATTPVAPEVLDRGRDAAEAAEVDPPTLHECRHGYASLMIAAGVKALSTFMRHANTELRGCTLGDRP
jgi:integrase